MPDNAILRDLRAARRAAGFTGADRWALDVATCRHGEATRPLRLDAWAHLLRARGRRIDPRRVIAQETLRQARENGFLSHLPGGDAA